MNTYEIHFQMLGGSRVSYTLDSSSEDLALEKAITNLKKDGYEKYLPCNPEKYAKVCTKLSR